MALRAWKVLEAFKKQVPGHFMLWKLKISPGKMGHPTCHKQLNTQLTENVTHLLSWSLCSCSCFSCSNLCKWYCWINSSASSSSSLRSSFSLSSSSYEQKHIKHTFITFHILERQIVLVLSFWKEINPEANTDEL